MCVIPLLLTFAGIDLFDRELFALSASEASSIDPQQRLLLEETMTACSDAQMPIAQLINTNVGESPERFHTPVNFVMLEMLNFPFTYHMATFLAMQVSMLAACTASTWRSSWPMRIRYHHLPS